VLSESIGPQQEAIAATSLILSFGREQEDSGQSQDEEEE